MKKIRRFELLVVTLWSLLFLFACRPQMGDYAVDVLGDAPVGPGLSIESVAGHEGVMAGPAMVHIDSDSLVEVVSKPALADQAPDEEPAFPVETVATSAESARFEFTLQTLIDGGRLAYIGVGGEVDGVVNPDLVVPPGATVYLTLVNGDGMPHDLFLPDFDAKSSFVSKIGESTELTFEVGDTQSGSYIYYCTVSGHRKAGQEGKLIVTGS